MFCPNPLGNNIVDHINRNKWDNRAENLRWVTAKQNAANVTQAKKNRPARFYEGSLEDFNPILVHDSNYLVSKDGIFINGSTRRIIEGGVRNGYIRIAVRGKSEPAHRLVWEAFNSPISKGFMIDHIDGDRSNNRLSNLRLVSQSQNMMNAYNNGHRSVKPVVQYTKSGEYIKSYPSLAEAARNILKDSVDKQEWGDKEHSVPVAIRSSIDRQGTCYGYLWFWEGQDTEEKIQQAVTKNSVDPHCSGITAYYPNGSFYKHYDKIKDACADVKCSRSTILRGHNATRPAKGYYWVMDSDEYSIEDIL